MVFRISFYIQKYSGDRGIATTHNSFNKTLPFTYPHANSYRPIFALINSTEIQKTVTMTEIAKIKDLVKRKDNIEQPIQPK